MISLDDIVCHKPELISSGLDDELVLLSLQTGKYYGINAVGKAIFKRLAKPIRVQELCCQLQDEYHVSQEQCECDVLSFLNRLNAQDLLLKQSSSCLSQDACLSASLSV